MGLTHVTLTVKPSRDHPESIEVKFLVDSGAVYSLVPGEQLKKLELKAHRSVKFVLADGTDPDTQVGDAYFEYQGQGSAGPVIFGEAGDEPLLGALTLESLGLVLNPFSRELQPMRLMLAHASARGERFTQALADERSHLLAAD